MDSQPFVPLTEIDEQRQKLRDKISGLQATLVGHQATLALLDRLAESAIKVNGSAKRHASLQTPRAKAETSGFPPRSGLNEVIRQIVRQHPGLTTGEVVDKIIDSGMKSTSPNPRRAFYSSVDTLRRRGHIVRKHGKKLYIADNWKEESGGSTATSG